MLHTLFKSNIIYGRRGNSRLSTKTTDYFVSWTHLRHSIGSLGSCWASEVRKDVNKVWSPAPVTRGTFLHFTSPPPPPACLFVLEPSSAAHGQRRGMPKNERPAQFMAMQTPGGSELCSQVPRQCCESVLAPHHTTRTPSMFCLR